MYGEGEPDTIWGGSGGCCSEQLIGGPGNDQLLDNDVGGDYDFACGNGGSDTIRVNDGDALDTGIGGLGIDYLYGNPGDSLNEGDATCPP